MNIALKKLYAAFAKPGQQIRADFTSLMTALVGSSEELVEKEHVFAFLNRFSEGTKGEMVGAEVLSDCLKRLNRNPSEQTQPVTQKW